MNNFKIFRKTNVFNIFEQCTSDYENKTILDFGGNRGNLITSSKNKIKLENYTCLDVSKQALALCEKENPGVKIIHWDYYHPQYNPQGHFSLEFPKCSTYDIIFANSVFTHMSIEETILHLKTLAKYTDKIIFTYIDPHNKKFIKEFCNKYYDLQFEKKDYSYVTDSKGLFWSAFKTDYLLSRIKDIASIEFGKTTWFNYAVLYIK